MEFLGADWMVKPMTEGNQKLWEPEAWSCLNDTIMGGTSQAGCRLTPEGLLLEGELVAYG